ncbi:histone-lysine N-methyltransferase ASHR2 [Impatiens glandulifera]|uniref:histone-lysine N-methyltransferase ASHR2 n=1 Tax=Impatiens glandulifera TaxID=253017 RepID=UPI001FB0DE49|nr:histone-lysine N-methyltransferase ASHR2 [Impatiens glandulifera]
MGFQAAVNITEIAGRGRSLVTSQPLRAGQIVLKDSPLILYSASPFIKSSSPEEKPSKGCYCSHCFKATIFRQSENQSFVPCPSCSNSTDWVLFCSPNCQSSASVTSHTPWVCQALSRLRDGFSSSNLQQQLECQVQARFLVAAYNLAVISPANFMILLSLQGSSSSSLKLDDSTVFLHSLISNICPPIIPSSAGFSFSPELTAALLSKDKLNAFGLMEPFAEKKERSVRAYGIYPNASFFNHDCLPNACRFDYLDADGGEMNNTDIIVRVIHDLPQGREICLSYFPVNLCYSDRQKRLKEDYGFTCCCDRCKVEANWKEEVEVEEEDEEDMDEDADEMMDEGENDFPHQYFFLRYMCGRKNCGGTLAPVAPSSSEPSTLMECNVCGKLKSEEEDDDDDDDDGEEGSMDDGDDAFDT